MMYHFILNRVIHQTKQLSSVFYQATMVDW
jgi:hypothetical protein